MQSLFPPRVIHRRTVEFLDVSLYSGRILSRSFYGSPSQNKKYMLQNSTDVVCRTLIRETREIGTLPSHLPAKLSRERVPIIFVIELLDTINWVRELRKDMVQGYRIRTPISYQTRSVLPKSVDRVHQHWQHTFTQFSDSLSVRDRVAVLIILGCVFTIGFVLRGIQDFLETT